MIDPPKWWVAIHNTYINNIKTTIIPLTCCIGFLARQNVRKLKEKKKKKGESAESQNVTPPKTNMTLEKHHF